MTIKILICSAPEDERMAGTLKKHLSLLERKGLIALLGYGNVGPGIEWKQAMRTYLDEAQMILLLISKDFLDSHYCYGVQMQQAIKRHESKDARVIPIILRSVFWGFPPLDKLQALPDNNKPISDWTPQDNGFTNVVTGIAKVVQQWNTHSLPDPIVERKVLITALDQLIEIVKVQLQPPPRAFATAKTLQQLSIFIPYDVTLADLLMGWRTLSRPAGGVEEAATLQRRVTCGQLADLGSQFTTEQGNMEQAIKTWQAWREAFQNSDDPRQTTMATTFAREVRELQDAYTQAQ